MVPRLALVALAAAVAVPAWGCRSTPDVRYAPRPLETVVRSEGADEPLARVLVSVRGIRMRPDEEGSERRAMVVRLRVENETGEPIELARETLLLVDAQLEPFGPPAVEADEGPGTEVPPGEARGFTLSFPFLPGQEADRDALAGLNLKLGLRHAGGVAMLGTTFERVQPEVRYVRDPWWPYGPYSFGFHGSIHDH